MSTPVNLNPVDPFVGVTAVGGTDRIVVATVGDSGPVPVATPPPRGNSGGPPPPPPPIRQMPAAPPVQRIQKPIMGDVVILPSGTEIAWVGGKPKLDWTGLDICTMPIPTPAMYRDVGAKDVKSFSYCTRGLEPKLTLKDDLRAIARKVMSHLKQHGMDTISYVPDPANTSSMESVVEKPNLFTKEYVVSEIPAMTV